MKNNYLIKYLVEGEQPKTMHCEFEPYIVLSDEKLLKGFIISHEHITRNRLIPHEHITLLDIQELK